MKIVHLIYTQGISGAEKYLKHLLPGLKEHGISCELIVVCPKRSAAILTGYCKDLEDRGIKTTLFTGSRLFIVPLAWKINRYIKAAGFRIVHAHLLNSDLIAAIIKTLFNPKLYLISTKHGYEEKILEKYEPGKYIQLRDLYFYITRFTLSKIDQNIAVSNAIAELYYNLKLSKTFYPFIHHGITVEDFNVADYMDACRKAKHQLIIVGRIELFKGHRFLIDALPAVIAAFPETKLLVLGEGSEKNNCVAQINKLCLQKHIEFMGFQPHPYSYISVSDVIILPSLFEPFGLVYIEAFAHKVPVVAFDTPAGNEIILHNETGLLVEKGDSQALAEKIIYLLSHAAERKRLGEQAFDTYKNSFTTALMVKKTADWYAGLPLKNLV